MIKETLYKNVKAIKIYNEFIEATILPKDGGKIASLFSCRNKEYLYQNPSTKYLRLSYDGIFAKAECSGFDDMFPTIDEDFVKLNNMDTKYPEHGEICRLSFDYKIKKDALILSAFSSKFGYRYTKKIFIQNNSIIIDYEIENNNDYDFPCLFGLHLLASSTNKGIIETGCNNECYLMFDNKNQFGNNDSFINQTKELLQTSTSIINCYKIYYLDSNNNYVRYKYGYEKELLLEYDPNIFKNLGLWINNGFFNNMYCVGIEPCTIAFDNISNAKKHQQQFVLKPKEKLNTSIKITLS